LFEVPDGFNDDLPRLAVALGFVAGLNSLTREIVSYFAATCAKLGALPELFDREVYSISNFDYFLPQASLTPRDRSELAYAALVLKYACICHILGDMAYAAYASVERGLAYLAAYARYAAACCNMHAISCICGTFAGRPRV
jgi:hypothetical protein